jgi:hypothetical protein
VGPREVELVGIFPATLSPCSVCDVTELGSKLAREQAREAPAAAAADAEVTWRIAEAVFARYGTHVRIRLTPLDSPRGFWLSLRHRLGGGMRAIVAGRIVSADPQEVLSALA